jgi:hypothetical protein
VPINHSKKQTSRAHLFTLAENFGIRQNRTAAIQKVRADLIKHYKSEQGQHELEYAPRISVEHSGDFPLQDQSVERIVDLLMMEVEAYANDIERDQNKNQVDPSRTVPR